jgi:polar amino acid transport system substrate-binding protein
MKPNVLRGRSTIIAFLLLPALVLAGCGGTASPEATSTPAAQPTAATEASPTTAMAEATPTTAEAAATPTTEAAGEATATTGAAGTETTGGGVVQPGATPVSDWKPGAHANSIPAPSKLVSAGTFTVGSDVSYPPQEYMDAGGNPIGVDMDIAQEIASRLGLQLKVINFKFDNLLPALQAGQFDVIVSAMTITDERKQVVDFVPYFEAGQAVLVKKGNPAGIKTLDDLSGKTAVAQQGTTEETTLNDLNAKFEKDGKAKVNILTYPSDTDAVDQLRIGRADATLHDSPVAAYYSKLYPEFEVAIANFDSAPEGIAVAKNNADMLTAVQKAIDEMKSDGTLAQINDKWGVK